MSALGLLSGCLGSNYTVDRDELYRLASIAPAERGQAIRGTQRFTTDRTPQATAPAPVDPRARASVGIHVIGVLPPPIPGHHPVPFYARSRNGSGGGSVSGGGSGGGGGGGGDKLGAILLIAGSAFVGVGLAATEGMRHDGWVSTNPNHPVYLEGPGGEVYWVPLSQLDLGLAMWAREGVIDEEDGHIERGPRAPLDRVGFTFEMNLGGGLTASAEDVDSQLAFFGRPAFGAFPIQQLGFLVGLDIGVGAGVEWRPHAEIQIIPFAVGPVHFGVYGQGGYLYGSVERNSGGTANASSWYAGGGMLVQLDLTTRLALTLRGGVMTPFEDEELLPQASLGLSIY
ncbi:MAG: hypothetical protein AAGF12_17550 [Myxococcota bacterium]